MPELKKGLDIHLAARHFPEQSAGEAVRVPNIQEADVWKAVALYKHLFERGESLEQIIDREKIEIKREELPPGVPSMHLVDADGHGIFVVDLRLTDTDYRRAVGHELWHYFNPKEDEADPEHPHAHDRNARVFGELVVLLPHHSIPPMDLMALIVIAIDKTLEFV